jgi:IclR family mhp operon transcriptional activator
MVVRETTHRFSRLSFHRAMVGRRLPLLLTASGLTWLAFAPDHERQAMIEILAASGRGVSAGAEPEKLAAILERTRRRATAKTFAAGSRRRKSPPSPYRSAASSGLLAA